MRGMELIRAQDFNNRLVKVGVASADGIVILFNTIIDKLRNERLHNIEQEGFLRKMVEASPMGVLILDFDGVVASVNESFLRITGIGKDDLLTGQNIESVRNSLVDKMREVPLGENRIVRGGDFGTCRCYHLSFLQTGFPREFFLIESLTEELMMAERAAYEKVIRVISHEINNTMGGVRSVLETLEGIVEEEELKEVIGSCDNRCDEMCRFVGSYADVVRVPAPLLRRVDVGKEMRRMVPFLEKIAGGAAEISFHEASGEATAMADTSLLQQVVVNIIKNARESILEKKGKEEFEGKILIETGKRAGKTYMEIANNGVPISVEVSANLFSPFFTTKTEGRGLGLMLVSEILRKHHADYSLSTGVDGLTRFTIIF